MIKIKRVMDPKVLAAGQAALAKYRAEKAKAQKKGGKFYEEWLADEELKRARKKVTPILAIKNFCNECVETRQDITDCTAKQCSLWIYRPYQKGAE